MGWGGYGSGAVAGLSMGAVVGAQYPMRAWDWSGPAVFEVPAFRSWIPLHAIQACGVDPATRAEQLAIADFARLAGAL